MTKNYTIEEIEKILTEISPWPYKRSKTYEVCHVSLEEDQSYGMLIPHCDVFGENKENDSTFFTAAPEIIRFLLDELKEKERLLEVAQKMYRDSQEAFNVAAKILNQIK